jgi:hypothetical protein
MLFAPFVIVHLFVGAPIGGQVDLGTDPIYCPRGYSVPVAPPYYVECEELQEFYDGNDDVMFLWEEKYGTD